MEAPKIPSFLKTKYHFKRFNFQPRYYDPEKERLEYRKKRIEEEIKGRNESGIEESSIERRARMKMSFEDTWHNRRGRETRKSNITIAIIVVILLGITYFIKQKLGL